MDETWINIRRRTGVANTKVPKPIAGDGEGHGLGTDLEREDFSSDDPGDGTPCGREPCLEARRQFIRLTQRGDGARTI